jgi:hypothetical protein
MEKFCFTKEELELLQDAIQSWLLHDFQKEIEERKKKMKTLYGYIEHLKGETN